MTSPRRQDPTGPAVVHGSGIEDSPRCGLGPTLTQPALGRTGRPSGLRVTCGLVGADVSKAVEIISLRRQVLGSAAYRMLKQTAESADLSVREMARVVVHAPMVPHQDAPD